MKKIVQLKQFDKLSTAILVLFNTNRSQIKYSLYKMVLLYSNINLILLFSIVRSKISIDLFFSTWFFFCSAEVCVKYSLQNQ